MSMTSGYLRYVDVSDSEIVFTAANDLWLAPLAGGKAQRLTASGAQVICPVFSPSGRSIAWVSWVDGAPDVYVLDRDSGEVARLTYWSQPGTRTVGWLDDERVIVSSAFSGPFPQAPRLFSLDSRGDVTPLKLGQARSVSYGPNGAIALVTANGRDSSMWKRYRGGTASKIWLDARGTGEWVTILPGELAGKYAAGWFGDRLFFSSDLGAGQRVITDPTAQAQLYSVNAQGEDLQQHTFHDRTLGYVRDPRTDGKTIVYHARGRLYAMSGLDAEPKEIEIDLGIPAPAPLRLSPEENLGTVIVDQLGNGSLVDWRGAAYYLTHRAGPARAVSALPGVRVREPGILGKTGKAIVVTDAEGEDALEIVSLTTADDPERIAHGKLGRVLHLAANPAGDTVATVSHDGVVRIVRLSGEIIAAGVSKEGEATDLVWSPDGRYLVWRSAVGNEGDRGQLVCVDTSTKPGKDGYQAVALTKGTYDDRSPAFTADGKYLAFLSARNFDPSYDEHFFALSFGSSYRPWLVPLKADEPAPFGVAADGWALGKDEDESESGKKGKDKKKPLSVEIDVDGFEDRLVAFPVPAGEYRELTAAKGGLLWIHEGGDRGVLGSTYVNAKGKAEDALERFDLETRRLEVLVPKVADYSVSGNGERIVVRHDNELTVLPADKKISDDDDPDRVQVDLSRLRREINPRDEWRQMFDENGRLMQQHFWRADLDGVDWAGVLADYRPVVERLHTRDDLVDLLWEVVAELNTSHCYVIPPAPPIDTKLSTGKLGADLTRNSRGIVIERILPSDSTDPRAWSPLAAAGVGAKPGDVIVAIDGQPVAGVQQVGALLQGAVGKPVEITLGKGKKKPRRVAVVPIASETPLRYQDWVASRKAYVAKASGGRLGYVHVPDMQANGWAQIHRMIDEATRSEGVILDVRYNNGGHTSQMVIERFSRQVISWDYGRYYFSPMTYPACAVRGPVVLVTNQWAGSDGDIVNAVAQARGLGPVVGERTWGGVIGIDGRFNLVDGTEVTQPRYATWIEKHGWDVENYGVDPDVEVIVDPAAWENEADIQLDTAVAIALRTLEEKPAAIAPTLPEMRFSPKS